VKGRERVAGGLSLLGGLAHAAAGPEHFAAWWGYGLFFLAAALAQAVYGLLLLTQGIVARGGWPAWRRRVYWAGIAGNLFLVLFWALTRTAGVPLGPGAGDVEPIGWLDLSSKAIELATAGVLASLLWERNHELHE
jgi:hypothetical protein